MDPMRNVDPIMAVTRSGRVETAVNGMDGETFAAMLDRAIERSGKGREIEQIDAAPT